MLIQKFVTFFAKLPWPGASKETLYWNYSSSCVV